MVIWYSMVLKVRAISAQVRPCAPLAAGERSGQKQKLRAPVMLGGPLATSGMLKRWTYPFQEQIIDVFNETFRRSQQKNYNLQPAWDLGKVEAIYPLRDQDATPLDWDARQQITREAVKEIRRQAKALGGG